jgi:hypothetical protein
MIIHSFSLVWLCQSLGRPAVHLPIGISFDDDVPLPRTACTYVNLKKAKWGLYTSEVESLFASEPLPISTSTGEKVFRWILLTASKHNIPAGYRKNFQPGMPREAVDLANERDCLRELNPQDPEIQRLYITISDIINHEAMATWIKNVEDSHPRDSPEKHWRLLKMLSGKRAHQPPNQPITFSKKSFSRPLAIANRFCKQFSSVKPHKSNKRSCRINRGLKKKHHLDPNFCPFTDVLTKGAIQK